MPVIIRRIDQMSLPISIKKSVEEKLNAFFQQRIPENLHDRIRLSYNIRGDSVTLIESRPHFRDPDRWIEMKIAQCRYDSEAGCWTLYCADRNERWHIYDLLPPQKEIDALISEIDADPTGIFWG
jgi:hypothetical protein